MTDCLDPIRSPDRLAALRQLDLLDTPSEESFDRLTRLAVKILDAPVAIVAFVDADRQFVKSCVGLPEPWASLRQIPLSHSFCRHVVSLGHSLMIEDAQVHPLVRENPAISELNVAACLGIPLTTSAGHVLGSLCVIDHQPRRWTELEIEFLQDLSASVMSEIDLRRAAREAKRQMGEKLALLEATDEGVLGIDRAGVCTFINQLLISRRRNCLATSPTSWWGETCTG